MSSLIVVTFLFIDRRFLCRKGKASQNVAGVQPSLFARDAQCVPFWGAVRGAWWSRVDVCLFFESLRRWSLGGLLRRCQEEEIREI